MLSGRGPEYEDFGVRFLLKNNNGTLFASCSAESSSGVIISIVGKNFFVYIDEVNNYWNLSKKRSASKLPVFRYGADYEIIKSGKLKTVSMDKITEKWLNSSFKLPTLSESMLSHKLLFKILEKCKAPKPYKFN